MAQQDLDLIGHAPTLSNSEDVPSEDATSEGDDNEQMETLEDLSKPTRQVHGPEVTPGSSNSHGSRSKRGSQSLNLALFRLNERMLYDRLRYCLALQNPRKKRISHYQILEAAMKHLVQHKKTSSAD